MQHPLWNPAYTTPFWAVCTVFELHQWLHQILIYPVLSWIVIVAGGHFANSWTWKPNWHHKCKGTSSPACGDGWAVFPKGSLRGQAPPKLQVQVSAGEGKVVPCRQFTLIVGVAMLLPPCPGGGGIFYFQLLPLLIPLVRIRPPATSTVPTNSASYLCCICCLPGPNEGIHTESSQRQPHWWGQPRAISFSGMGNKCNRSLMTNLNGSIIRNKSEYDKTLQLYPFALIAMIIIEFVRDVGTRKLHGSIQALQFLQKCKVGRLLAIHSHLLEILPSDPPTCTAPVQGGEGWC